MAWRRSQSRDSTPLGTCGAFRERAHIPRFTTRPHTRVHSHFTLTSPHFTSLNTPTSTYITPLHLLSTPHSSHTSPMHHLPFTMRHSFITCASPLGNITQLVIYTRRPSSLLSVGAWATLVYTIVISHLLIESKGFGGQDWCLDSHVWMDC
jgi:hypothetical protein